MKMVKIPGTKCDFCGALVKYDGPTSYGPWAYACQRCSYHLVYKQTEIDSSEDKDDDE